VNALISSSPRYLIVGGGCALLNTALLIALDKLGAHYVLATVISGMVLIPLSYVLHVRFTYRVVSGRGSFARYAAAQAVNTPIALLLFFLIAGLGGMSMVWAAPTVITLMFVYNLTSSFWSIAAHSKAHSVPKI
jgi:putative flippase GtrA